ncbi:DUF3141 domain-containing protein [Derxia gummosa]|uniref:DUF3141 domain-containing protein n=1 Tax=Derxia gummosa DSM 723 TaxID=1121388 RepID=A0A8B6XB22_9BURK|nr:DUF3141 domain-containing protein [Derxia gummosa]
MPVTRIAAGQISPINIPAQLPVDAPGAIGLNWLPPAGTPLAEWIDYSVDAWQRWVLTLDTLRERAANHRERSRQQAPNVLDFPFELVLDGRSFDRPVNYCLVRIAVEPAGGADPARRPFIVFDPRAGHGPGIGGMKHDSEIGVALGAGHPCYFVGFLPEPVPGQTLDDVCAAEARFIAEVAARHPEADGKPCLIGNCQAGWQIMMTTALAPEASGPLMLAGAPLSYWAGVHGRNPLRYLGGLLGGTWMTALAGDLGHGIFDGAHLVANFESMNPANTLWKKNYHLYADIDHEAPRFLEFEKWWGSPVLLNAGEMQAIADNLFVGNRLVSGEMRSADGTRIDLRNIRSPIIVFCSHGDNITPPQQALDWVLDLYRDEAELIAAGQTIIYCLHQTIGHLGIFVSASVARKEHDEFARAMDIVDVLPPGLYEASFSEITPGTPHAELATGRYVLRFEERGFADLRALGGNDAEDDLRFSAAARLSEINLALYRRFAAPVVQAFASADTAAWLRRLHPNRLRFEAFDGELPWMRGIAPLAQQVRAARRPVAADNTFLAWQRIGSDAIVAALDAWGAARDQATEAFFLNFYGAPALHALLGLDARAVEARRDPGHDLVREALAERDAARLARDCARGGLVEAAIRALLYIARGRQARVADERAFGALGRLRARLPATTRPSLAELKTVARAQAALLAADEAAAVAAIPALVAASPAAARVAVLDAIRLAVEASGEVPAEVARRLAEVQRGFDGAPAGAVREAETATRAAPARRRETTAG